MGQQLRARLKRQRSLRRVRRLNEKAKAVKTKKA